MSRSTTGWKTGCTARSSRTRRKSSAVVGEAKPAPAVFEAGLRLAGCDAAEALFVGDSVENDVAGARANDRNARSAL